MVRVDLSQRSNRELRSVLVVMPLPLKRKIVAVACAEMLSVNDVAIRELSAIFGLPFSPSGRTGIASPEKVVVVLRMSRGLKRALQRFALGTETSLNVSIVSLLSAALNVPESAANRVVPNGSSSIESGPRCA
jgi:hypothetical protein